MHTQKHVDEKPSTKRERGDDFTARKEVTPKPPPIPSARGYFHEITEISNLKRLWSKVRQSRSLQPRFIKFNERLLDYLVLIQARLRDGSFEFGPYQYFMVREKKMRSIANAPLKDRIVHWMLYEHLLAQWQRRFISHTFGNLPGRGTHLAVHQLADWARKPTLTHALQLDMSKYFSSIHHSHLRGFLLRREGNTQIRSLLEAVIDSFVSGPEFDHLFPEKSIYRQTADKGMPLGNLTSQIFANIYLNEFDHWMKESLRVPYYIRYVDDLLVLGESSKQLQVIQTAVVAKLVSYGLITNPNKSAIRRISAGVPFLGYIVWPNHISAGKYARNRYGKLLRGMEGKDKSSAVASYRGIFKHTGATR